MFSTWNGECESIFSPIPDKVNFAAVQTFLVAVIRIMLRDVIFFPELPMLERTVRNKCDELRIFRGVVERGQNRLLRDVTQANDGGAILLDDVAIKCPLLFENNVSVRDK